MTHHVHLPILNQYSTDSLSGEMTNQLLLGEEVRRLPDSTEVESCTSGYRGHVDPSGLTAGQAETTHFVQVPSTLLFAAPDIKTPDPVLLPMLAQVRVTQKHENFSKTPIGWIISDHLLPKDAATPRDLSALILLAKGYLETPYLWGGNSHSGLDCSGLMHILWRRFGVSLPRDSAQQVLAEGWQTVTEPRAGDLVFWTGHVGLMIDETSVLHAHAHAMRTQIEPLDIVHHRIAQSKYTIRRIV